MSQVIAFGSENVSAAVCRAIYFSVQGAPLANSSTTFSLQGQAAELTNNCGGNFGSFADLVYMAGQTSIPSAILPPVVSSKTIQMRGINASTNPDPFSAFTGGEL